MALLGLVGVAVIAITVYVTRLKPAAPLVDSDPWTGDVVRGDFVRDVRGAGTLVPEDIRWIVARTSGRVDEIILHPGAKVTPGSIILKLSSPELQQQVRVAELNWKSSQAQMANQQATLKQNLIQQEAAVKTSQQDVNLAKATLDANEELAKQNLISPIVLKTYRSQLDTANTRLDVAQKQLENTKATSESTLAPVEATVAQQRAQYDLLLQQADQLNVRAGMNGVLQIVPVEVGAQVGAGTQLARVADPSSLKATLRISETQTKDLTFGQQAEIDTRSGKVQGHVVRIDPSAQGGTVGVDVTLDGPLPQGARQDMSVDGTITIERLTNVVSMGRPSSAQENSTINIFKVVPNTKEAVRVQVKLGKTSVNSVEVLEGLSPGDKVILSDMSQYDAFDRVRLPK